MLTATATATYEILLLPLTRDRSLEILQHLNIRSLNVPLELGPSPIALIHWDSRVRFLGTQCVCVYSLPGTCPCHSVSSPSRSPFPSPSPSSPEKEDLSSRIVIIIIIISCRWAPASSSEFVAHLGLVGSSWTHAFPGYLGT